MKIALGVEYDGSHFSGWQMQPNGIRTVQGELEKALSIIANEKIRVVCAGRTDTGVHATGQVVNFETQSIRPENAWVQGVNTKLPNDVTSLWSCEVNEDFSARFTAIARQYRYVICNRRARPAVLSKKVTWRYSAMNTDAMHKAAQALIGEHDFSSFRSSSCQAKHARRCVHYVNIHSKEGFIYIDIKANAFLHHMVRNIVGSLLEVAVGDKPIEWIAELLALQDRTKAGITAPADGLYMVKVTYPEENNIPDQSYLPCFV
jgi:tRNA pseudouridine38-40 synthase